jgi:hypothetical protein
LAKKFHIKLQFVNEKPKQAKIKAKQLHIVTYKIITYYWHCRWNNNVSLAKLIKGARREQVS